MRVLGTAFLVLTVMGGLTACTKKGRTAGEGGKTAQAVFENKEFGVKLRYPAAWTTKEPQTGVVVFASPNGAELTLTMDVVVQQGATLAQFTKQNTDILKEQTRTSGVTFNLDSSKTVSLSNTPAQEIHFTLQGQNKVRGMAYWILKKDKAYSLTYTAFNETYERDLNEMQDVMKSLEI